MKEPMTEATIKVSKWMPQLAMALDELLADLGRERVRWVFFAFTDGRTSYTSGCKTPEERTELVGYFRRWLEHAEAGTQIEQPPVTTEQSKAIARQLRDMAKAIEEKVDEVAGEHVLIALLIFPQGYCQYASNGVRADVHKAMREWLDMVDAGAPHIPAHEWKEH